MSTSPLLLGRSPRYRRCVGRHHDEDGDGVADQLDDQSRAYRENDNPTTDEEIAAIAEEGGVLDPASATPRTVEVYEAMDWDAGREDPPVSP